jgi:hypothetical protein
MNAWNGPRRVQIVSAVMRADGTPSLALTEVDVTCEQFQNGIHYYLAEADLLEQGYEEPFVHFDEGDLPTSLVDAVKEYLAARWCVPDLVTDVKAEKP